MDKTEITIGTTVKKKFLITVMSSFTLFGILLATMGFTGTAFAVPLGGMGDFYVEFDSLEGEGFELNPHIGETGNADEAPLVRNQMDQATIENLHIYKDLRMPTGGWVRVNITASEPTEIDGLIQDARFIDANLKFDDMAILQTNTSGMTPEEVFQNNWSHDAETVTITDAKIVTDYLFQNMVALNGAEISLEHISEPEYIEGVSADNQSDDSIAAGSSDNDSNGSGLLPETASHLFLPIVIGTALMMIGGVILLVRKRRRPIEE
ncbi:DUF6230 family protein [Lentibacillus sp. CBA3610]|uniref:DUF6230 family protein n=1 Tax=Lentibacillus sp. CBA3610 TaxID=2518176 RepID=UPI0020D2004C|nr:DUF6230 family protein [Lentibacillus sp. CBA3610]